MPAAYCKARLQTLVSNIGKLPQDAEWKIWERFSLFKQLLNWFPAFQPFFFFKSISLLRFQFSKIKKVSPKARLNYYFNPDLLLRDQAILFFITVFAGNSQFMTSFLSAACQYLTAISGLHTLAKTMYWFSAAFVRLIGSFFTWHLIKFFPFTN